MTDQEIIYKAIREVVNMDNPSQFAAHNSTCYAIAKYVCKELREELDSTPAEQLSEELEKAADYYLDNVPTAELMYGSYEGPDVHDAFVAGARWQKDQFINKACEWLRRSVDTDEEVKLVDGEPEIKSFIQKNLRRIEVANKIVADFKKAMEDEQ